MKYKIVHIHTDVKFLQGSEVFDNEVFDNIKYYIINSDEKINLPNNVICIQNFEAEFEKLILCLNNASMIVIWGLSAINRDIVLAVNDNVKIAWRFFGFELYSKMVDFTHTKMTLRASYSFLKRFAYTNTFGKKLLNLKNKNKNDKFIRSIKRINYFIGLSRIEYEFLKLHFPYLPEFIFSPFINSYKEFSYSKIKPYKIILGHNAHAFNNHLEIMELLRNKSNDKDIDFYMFMSYGRNKKYIENVKQNAKQIPNLTIIDKMLPFDKFVDFYSSSHAFVLNAHRQCGMGNVFVGLKNGVKIYLNEKNIIYEWLKSEGFIIFTIDDFKRDLSINNFILSEEEALFNFNCFKSLTHKYSVENFQQKIIGIL
jgi:dTDP-N-acetylfucosamine:lipid II N-acetylfucosaminyltransferase